MMGQRMQRTQLLLEPEQHRALAEIARQEGRSISDVVREMVQRQIEQRRESARADRERRLAALERIRRHRDQAIEKRGGRLLDLDVVALIRQAREERDARALNGFDDRR
jgi:predicted CopG family antitoxin